MHCGHLSFEQIDELSEKEGLRTEGSRPEEEWSHVDNCAECRSLLAKCREINTQLGKLSSSDIEMETEMNCPEERVWFDVAAGMLLPEEVVQQLQHAATCQACRARLKAAARIFEDGLTPEEESLLKSLPSNNPQRQRKLANRLSSLNGKMHSISLTVWARQRPGQFTLTFATVVAIFLVLAVVAMQRASTSEAEHLIAQVYTENRTLQMRIPLAAHGEIHQRRAGENGSLAVSSSAFRKAIDEITSGTKGHPNDPKWKILNAQSDLLDWRYQDAFAVLQRIPDTDQLAEPVWRDKLLTRALALYEQGEFENQMPSFGEAENLLGQVLRKEPDNVVALFNRAIVCEKLSMYRCAMEDWGHLLNVEKDPGWAGEARMHLKQIQEKKTPDSSI